MIRGHTPRYLDLASKMPRVRQNSECCFGLTDGRDGSFANRLGFSDPLLKHCALALQSLEGGRGAVLRPGSLAPLACR